jgi:hypothetical protein
MASLFGSLLGSGAPRKVSAKQLLERLGSATQLDDRREALEAFKELSASEPLRLIDKGGIGLLVSLAQDPDTQLARDALETLVNLCDVGVPAVEDKPGASRVAGEHNTAVLLSNPPHLPTALAAVEETDFYIRFHGVTLLQRLLANAPDRTHAALLAAPATVGRVLSVLDDGREIVRNEALRVLGALAASAPPELANILAFAGAFEPLLGLAEALAGADIAGGDAGAGAVLRDVFDVLGQLLSRHPANRRLFAEGGCLPRLSRLLELPANHKADQAARVAMVCRVLWQLLQPTGGAGAKGGYGGAQGGGHIVHGRGAPSSDRGEAGGSTGAGGIKAGAEAGVGAGTNQMGFGATVNQTGVGAGVNQTGIGAGVNQAAADASALRDAVLTSGALGLLSPLPTSPATATDQALRLAALAALSRLVHGHPPSAAQLAAARATRSLDNRTISEPLLPRYLAVGLRSNPLHQALTLEFVSSALEANPALQLALAAPLAPQSTAHGAGGAIQGGGAGGGGGVGVDGSAGDGTGNGAAGHNGAGGSSADSEGSLAVLAVSALVGPTVSSSDASAPAADKAWLGAGVLAALIRGNADAARILLRANVHLAANIHPPANIHPSANIHPAANIPPSAPTPRAGEPGQLFELLCSTMCDGLFASPARGQDSAGAAPPSAPSPPVLLLAALRLLLVLIWACPDAASAFVSRQRALPALADALCLPTLDVHARGVAAAVLGACLLHTHRGGEMREGAPAGGGAAGDTAGGGTDTAWGGLSTVDKGSDTAGGGGYDSAGGLDGGLAPVLIGMVTRRVGLRRFEAAWEGMRRHATYLPAPPIDAWAGDAALSAAGAAHGVILYDPHTHAMLEDCHAQVHRLLLRAYALPPPAYALHPPSPPGRWAADAMCAPGAQASVAGRSDAAGEDIGRGPGENTGGGGGDNTDGGPDEGGAGVIESFKEVIRLQDAEAKRMARALELAQAEVGHARAVAAAAQLAAAEGAESGGKLSSAEAGVLRGETARLKGELVAVTTELSQLREKASAEAARRTQAVEAGRAELEAMTAAYTDTCAVLAQRERELAAARRAGGGDIEGRGGDMEAEGAAGGAGGEGESAEDGVAKKRFTQSGGASAAQLSLQLSMLRAHADGVDRELREARTRADELASEVEARAQAEELANELREAKAEAEAARSEAEAARAETTKVAQAKAATLAQDGDHAATVHAQVAGTLAEADAGIAAALAEAHTARAAAAAAAAELAAAAEARSAAEAGAAAAARQLEEERAAYARQRVLLEASVSSSESATDEARSALAEMQHEHEELLICLAEQDALNRTLQARLNKCANGPAVPQTGGKNSHGLRTPATVAGAGPVTPGASPGF